ncbi:Beige/BEACH domain protein [Dictyocaulus viviparus]|uniref:Beige/BEACH domain protein n=1 Tax=Dictyocaulus viviparus TaxID=29172 RepID=A0A0D8Y6P3_DICVI|nr:Beige/BEACH domain protein [Dictyocaulus viviparus]
MKTKQWDDKAFTDILVPAVCDFVNDGQADTKHEPLLDSVVVFRKVNQLTQELLSDQIYFVVIGLKVHSIVESEFRPLRLIPHIIPIIAIISKDGVITVVSSELGPDWVNLNTVLRHYHSNIEPYSQIHNFVVASISDVYFQLDRLQFYVIDPQFFCDNVFWLICDPFARNDDPYPHEDFDYQNDVTLQWIDGSISNYDYITILNKAAGRVRGEIYNHPVFPWVCDFKQKDGGWRDLTRTKYRLTKGDDQLGFVVEWVPREYPASMVRMYEWTPDECIPEFYDDPSILISQHADMPDLELPSFVSSPAEFIEWHREMLESDEVSRDLHEWIDLNFGHALAGKMAIDSMNVHMCFSEPNFHIEEHSVRKTITLLEMYRSKIKGMKFRTIEEKMFISFVHTMFRFRRQYLRFYPLNEFEKNNQRFIENSSDIPQSWLNLIEEIVNGCSEFSKSGVPLYLLRTLDVPVDVASFHDTITKFYSFHLLRKSIAVQGNEQRLQSIMLREIEALKSAMVISVMENSLVRLFERMILDKESAVQTVHRLFVVVCRTFGDESFEQILEPLVELLNCDSSVKLLDRRFLLLASIAYGTPRFLKEFLPNVIEAVASLQIDRSVVAKESVIWLAKRYGPVISARFITANLLRVLASCYSGLVLIGGNQEPESVFTLSLVGDECGARVEACLAEIASIYSVTFVTVQYLSFCVDLVEQATKRLTPLIEAGLMGVFKIVRLSAKAMSDHQLMNYLEDYIVNKVIAQVLRLALDATVMFSDNRSRIIVAAGAVSLLYNISMRIGLENTRMYAKKPFELLFGAFTELYEADEQLKISPKKNCPTESVASIPLWFVSSVIDRFATSWGVPLLSSFCSDPAFLVPFVSSQGIH